MAAQTALDLRRAADGPTRPTLIHTLTGEAKPEGFDALDAMAARAVHLFASRGETLRLSADSFMSAMPGYARLFTTWHLYAVAPDGSEDFAAALAVQSTTREALAEALDRAEQAASDKRRAA